MINPSEIIESYFDEFNNFQFVFDSNKRITPLCHTFDNSVLSFLVNINDLDVIILPHPPRVIPYDATEVILREVLGIVDLNQVSYPKWIRDLNTRRQDDILSEISDLKEQISFLEQQVKEKEQQFSLHQKLQQALFVRGNPLVEACYEILSSMGFKP